MSEINSTDPSQHAGNRPQTVGMVEQYVKGLLGQDIVDIPLSHQGKAIVDRFVGSVFANDTVTTSQESGSRMVAPLEILRYIQAVATGKERANAITRTDGLRGAVSRLMDDYRTQPELEALGNAFLIDRTSNGDEITFRSLDGLEGYVHMLAGKYVQTRNGSPDAARPWDADLVDSVYTYARNEGSARRWKERGELSGSVISSIRQSGNEFNDLLRIARDAGVDIGVVSRTAEHLARIYKENKHLGDLAIGHSYRRQDT